MDPKLSTQIRNLPANLADVNLFRHPKADPSPDYLQTIKTMVEMSKTEMGRKHLQLGIIG